MAACPDEKGTSAVISIRFYLKETGECIHLLDTEKGTAIDDHSPDWRQWRVTRSERILA